MIFNDAELALIKATFAENDELIYLIRKVLLQFPLKEAERKTIKAIMNEDVFNVVKKRMYPEMSDDFPLGQLGDIYQTLTNDLKSKTVDEMAPLFKAKQLEIEYLEQQFSILKDIDTDFSGGIRLDGLKSLKNMSAEDCYINTVARNFIVAYIDNMLILIKNIAGQKTETVEDQKKRMTRDSSK